MSNIIQDGHRNSLTDDDHFDVARVEQVKL
jgi:hypothetical protein